MKKASILIIGNEILSGRTQDLNINYISKKLAELGISNQEARVICDDKEVIKKTALELNQNYDYVFSCGGIGATHDDITSESLAYAFDRPFEYHPKAMEILKTYYGERFNDARARMGMMPRDVELIDNPVSKAPGFIIENIFVMAGVPSIMQAMFETIIAKLVPGTPITYKTITCSVPEGNLALDLEKIAIEFSDLEIGSYPFYKKDGYGVSIVVRGSDLNRIELATQLVCQMIESHKDTFIIE
jgi:molybdenum cofactor synthesis domain-containing protein